MYIFKALQNWHHLQQAASSEAWNYLHGKVAHHCKLNFYVVVFMLEHHIQPANWTR